MDLPQDRGAGHWSFGVGARGFCRARRRCGRTPCRPPVRPRGRRRYVRARRRVRPRRRLEGEGLHEPLGGRGEDLQNVVALLPGGRDDGPEKRENARALEGAETAGDFHLDLPSSSILFGEVVGEGHVEVGEEPQRLGFELLSACRADWAGASFGTSPALGRRLQLRQPAMIRQGPSAPPPNSVDEGLDLFGRKRPLARLPRRAHCRIGLAQRTARISSAQASLSNSIKPSSSRRIWALQKAW